MKKLFFVTWGVFSLLLAGVAIHSVWLRPSLASGVFLLLVGYYAFCFFELIRAAFQPWGLLGPRRRCGYWVCLILLPLALVPLKSAYQVWERGAYVIGPDASVGLGDSFILKLLVWLQELLGYIGPLMALLAIGLGVALVLLRLLRSQVAR